jgi:hypothetical protein
VCDVPAVEEPFEGEAEVADGGVGVEEDDEFVVGEEVCDGVNFGPGGVVGGDGGRLVVVVGVVVYCCCMQDRILVLLPLFLLKLSHVQERKESSLGRVDGKAYRINNGSKPPE